MNSVGLVVDSAATKKALLSESLEKLETNRFKTTARRECSISI